jgi:BlaI family transcriptional regulator, penicillinase repressor
MTEEPRLTDRELDIMSVLWGRGSGTVAEVRHALADKVGYTGVLKLLQILEEKGAVRHEQEGRAYRYFPLVERAAAGDTALARVVDRIFAGSAELAVARLVADRPLDAAAVERIKALLDAAAPEDGARASDEPERDGPAASDETDRP